MALSKWLNSVNPQRLAIRQKIQSNPYYRLQTKTEIAIAAELGVKIDVNQASVDDWLRLPGISIHQARSLVELAGIGVQLLGIEDLAAALSVPQPQLQPLAPLLYFGYYDSQSDLSPQRVNPNTASVAQLAQIPVIDSSLAEKIVQNRQNNGNYPNLAHLSKRLALEPQIVAQLMHYLQF